MDMPESLPKQIDRYQVVRLLGQGGAGSVYECLDPALQRRVAVKLLSGRDEESRTRFLTEARAVARLSHPGIATLFDAGSTGDGRVYAVQEFLDGVTVARLIDGHPTGLRPDVAAHLLLQVAQALAYAHDNRVIHRDVKPGNVMVTAEGIAKLLDFGIARVDGLLDNQDTAITRPGTVVGTPQYMAPEQMLGRPVTQSVDIYAFGALAYELLCGMPPHGRGHFGEIAVRLLQEAPQPLASRAGGIPAALSSLVMHCLAKTVEARPASMAEVAARLADLPRAWVPDVISSVAWMAASPTPDSPTLQGAGGAPAAAAGADVDDLFGLSPHTFAFTRGASAEDPLAAFVLGSAAPAARAVRPGQKLGRFVLHELISRGKSGDLYKAYDEVRGTLVGVRVVRASDAGARERLLRGGRIWIQLQHPNIVRVHEVHPDYEGQPGVIVTELVDGLNLEQLVAQRAPSLEQAVWIAMQTCEALAVIHALQVVHREVKPRNIIVSGPSLHVTLLDSGIARHENPEVDAFTKTGVFVGDLTYAAPEMARGVADQRSDIYGVAAVLYELVTRSKLPFPLPPDWQPERQLAGRFPARLVNALAVGLRRDPDQRYATIGELHDQLRPLAAGRTAPQVRPAVVALHGIRTQAAWQRAFLEVAARHGLDAHVDRWNFGYFSVFRFLAPWARLAKVRWFREAFQLEFREAAAAGSVPPSIVAHSFGTYILGNALLRYPYLRFDKVLLCGSILPRSFPWDQLIARGQVQAVRNEYGRHDIWTHAVGWFVPGTGPSGLSGFTASHPRLEQELFSFEHSEYFERGHMEQRWMPFLTAQVAQQPTQDRAVDLSPADHRPWGLFGLYALVLAAVGAAVAMLR